MNKEAMKLEMVDDEGENQAVRMFLTLYGGACGVTAEQMRKHLKMAGFDGAWPEWANSHNGHLTKAGAQLWIRHLFALAQPAHQEPVKVKTCDTCQFGERCNQWSCKNHSLWKPVQPAQQEPVAWGKPTDEMMHAFPDALDEYDEWANENKGTTECIRAMLSKALKASPPAQPQPFEIEWPEYNEHAMGCGLEGIDEYCRYRAMRYGWDCAIKAVKQAIPDSIYTSPPAQRVGLTNKKIDSIQQEWIAKGMSGSRSFARAIEAAHGIKENT